MKKRSGVKGKGIKIRPAWKKPRTAMEKRAKARESMLATIMEAIFTRQVSRKDDRRKLLSRIRDMAHHFATTRHATFVPRPAWKKPRRASGFI